MSKNKDKGKDAPAQEEATIDQTSIEIGGEPTVEPTPATPAKDEIKDLLDEAYEDVEAPEASLDYDRDITTDVTTLVVNNPVLREVSQSLGFKPAELVDRAWSSTYDNNVVEHIMLKGNVESLHGIANPAIRQALVKEAQVAAAEPVGQGKQRPDPFFIGTSRFICRMLQKQAEKEKKA